MRAVKITFLLLTIVTMMSWGVVLAYSSPVLIKLKLTSETDYQKANQLKIPVYHKFPVKVAGADLVIADFEKSNLSELDNAGLNYEIVDEEPWADAHPSGWSEGYYLISESEKTESVNLSQFGKVLVSAEKFYFMKITDENARQLAEKGYYIVKVFRRPLPLEYKPPVTLPKHYPSPPSAGSLNYPSIDSLLSLVSQDSLYAWDLRMQNFRTRYSYSDSIVKARDWLMNKFLSFGLDSVWLHHYYYDSNQWNVVATVVGTVKPDKVIVVGGHYDSVVYGSGTNPYTWAPGADDNATGTVATLEIARIIALNPLPVTVMFVPFAQEEQGLVGSGYFADYLSSALTDVYLMINQDMIAHSVDADPDVAIYAASSAMGFVDVMINMANTYTSLRPYYAGQTGGSDHYSFYQNGYDAVFAHEGDFFTNGWHKNYDVVDSLNFPYMKQVVQMCLATLITVAKSVGYKIGDPTMNGVIDLGDVVFLIDYVYKGGSAPDPFSSGDVTCDAQITLEDIVFLINYLYKNGPPPPSSC